jgi:hypothetical protein
MGGVLGLMKKLCLFMGIFWLLHPGVVLAKQWDPRLYRAMELSFSGHPEAAELLMVEYRKQNPEDPNGLFFTAIVREWKAGLGPGDHEGIHHLNHPLLEEALSLAEKQQRAQPDDVDALIDLGNAYFFLARNFAEQGKGLKAGTTGKKLEKPMKQALAKDPSRKEAYLALGAFHYFAGNTPKILAPFKKLLGIHGNKKEGLEELRKSLEGEHPFLWQTRYALVEIYSNPENNPDQALIQLAPFEEHFPRNPVIPMKKGYIFEKKAPSEAIKIYFNLGEQCGRQFLPCPKKFPYFAYSQAGLIALQGGNASESLSLLNKSLETDPGYFPKRTEKIKKWQKTASKKIENK